VETAITAGQTTKLIVTAYDIYGQRQVDANGTAKVADEFTVTFGPPTALDGAATFATWNLVDNKDGKQTDLLLVGGGQLWISYAWQEQKSICVGKTSTSALGSSECCVEVLEGHL
jgi:hypothetical protein